MLSRQPLSNHSCLNSDILMLFLLGIYVNKLKEMNKETKIG